MNQMTYFDVLLGTDTIRESVEQYSDLDNLRQNYDLNRAFSIIIPGDFTKYWNVNAADAEIEIAGQSSTLKFSFASVDFASVPDLYPQMRVTPIENRFTYLSEINATQMTLLEQEIQETVYDTLVIRLNFVDYQLVVQNTYTQFDPKLRINSFTCNGSAEYQKDCLEKWKLVDADANAQCRFEMLFYNQGDVVHAEIYNPDVAQTSFDGAKGQVTKEGITIILFHSATLFA